MTLLVLDGADQAEAQRLAEHLRASMAVEVVHAGDGQVASDLLPDGERDQNRRRGSASANSGSTSSSKSGSKSDSKSGLNSDLQSDPYLVLGPDGLALESDGMSLRGDLQHMERRLRPGNLSHELVVRAARLKGVEHPTAVDATAGLGEDSLLLAAAGFDVTMYERDPVIAALLRDSLRRAAAVPQLAQAVGRMRLVEGDSIEALEGMGSRAGESGRDPRLVSQDSLDGRNDTRPDLVLLDPMFPARHKSASVKKKLQLLQTLERPCDDEERLLQAARDAGPRKIIVKRPAKGPTLAGMKPSSSVSGKAIRFDCLVLPR